MDADALVHGFVRDRQDTNARLFGSPELTSFDLIEFTGLLNGLVAATVMSRAAADQAMKDVLPPEAPAGATPLRSAARHRQAGAEPVPRPQARFGTVTELAHPDPAPVRVVSLLTPNTEHSGLVLLSAEIWTSMLVLHAAYPRTTATFDEILDRQRPWAGNDDTGLAYKETGRTNSDVQNMIMSSRFLTPGPGSEARILSLTITDADFDEHVLDLLLR